MADVAPTWSAIPADSESALDRLADLLSATLKIPRQGFLESRQNATLLARKTFAYCAITHAEVKQWEAAAYMNIDRGQVADYVDDILRIIDGDETCDFENGSSALCAAIEAVGVAVQHGAIMDTTTPLDEATSNALALLKPSGELRRVRAIDLGVRKRNIRDTAPIVRIVNPLDLYVETAYQRDVSARSLRLIKKIVKGWDWRKFKPPICVKHGEVIVVIDGQHTAIAAATLGIEGIPIMLTKAPEIEIRADAFVAHNMNRLAMQPLQIFHANVAAGDKASVHILAMAGESGVTIPRATPTAIKPGQVTPINDIRRIYVSSGADVVQRVFTIAASLDFPLTRAATRGLSMILTQAPFADVAKMPNSRIANAINAIGRQSAIGLDATLRHHAASSGQPLMRAAATLIADTARDHAR